MEIDLIFKIAAVGMMLALLNIILSKLGRDDQAMLMTLTGLVVVLIIVVQKISDLFSLIKSLFGF